MPGTPGHLVHRFFDVLTARALTDAEWASLSTWLTPDESEMFLSQPIADQRHGYEAFCHVADAGVIAPDALAAAALHDVGKRHTGLGVVGRSVASVMILLGLDALWPRARAYRDHGEIASIELAKFGSAKLVVEFARSHHGPMPDGFDPDLWAVLTEADQPAKAWLRQRPPIT